MGNLCYWTPRRRHRGQGGFTLIELLVVIAILGILAAIVIFNVTGVTNRGSRASVQHRPESVADGERLLLRSERRLPH